jgi:hypothetical protein
VTACPATGDTGLVVKAAAGGREDGGKEDTGPTAALATEVEPPEFEAVTITRKVWPTSFATSV